MKNLTDAIYFLKGLSVYQNLIEDPMLASFLKALENIQNKNYTEALFNYSSFCKTLYKSPFKGCLSAYIDDLIRFDYNVFSKNSAKNNSDIEKVIFEAAKRDIECLKKISLIDFKDFKNAFIPIECPISEYTTDNSVLNIETYREIYKNKGAGIFARHNAFEYRKNNTITPVLNLDSIKLSDLKLYESQRQRVIQNTLSFLKGATYNNVLLYGDRGCGKSSTVKALLNEYKDQGLRIIQISKENLLYLGSLMEKISGVPQKFIIFIDDLTFGENDEQIGTLKAVLEGALYKQPENMAIYATTNRRHLIKETFSQREGDEIHRKDTIDESISLSDRFGLMITFIAPGKDDYLSIVEKIAKDKKINLDLEALFKEAERFALSKGNRSPRTARQFIDFLGTAS